MTFNLKKEWFDKIKSGEKTVEYRVICPYWSIRIYNNIMRKRVDDIDSAIITFALGYPKKGDTKKRIYAKVTKISECDGMDTDLKVNKRVFAIYFKKIRKPKDK